jgi:hypothetical protein
MLHYYASLHILTILKECYTITPVCILNNIKENNPGPRKNFFFDSRTLKIPTNQIAYNLTYQESEKNRLEFY